MLPDVANIKALSLVLGATVELRSIQGVREAKEIAVCIFKHAVIMMCLLVP